MPDTDETSGQACPEGYHLRPARARDDALLPEIEQRAGMMFARSPHPEVSGHDNAEVALFAAFRKTGLCLVAADGDDRPVGFAGCGRLDDGLHLYELDVDPAHGQRGLGRALLAAVVEEAAALSVARVTLSTFTDVPWNAPFYARHGFRVLSRDEYTPGLFLVAQHEREAGLKARCIMAREVAR